MAAHQASFIYIYNFFFFSDTMELGLWDLKVAEAMTSDLIQPQDRLSGTHLVSNMELVSVVFLFFFLILHFCSSLHDVVPNFMGAWATRNLWLPRVLNTNYP